MSRAPAPRPRAPLAAACVSLLALNALTALAWWQQSRQRVPTRLLIAPSGDQLDSEQSPVTLSFSRDMAPASEIGSGGRRLPWLLLEPPAPVRGRWVSPRTLELRCEGGFRRGTEYHLRLGEGALDLEGQPLARWSDTAETPRFRTPALQVLALRQIALTRDWEATVELEFSDAVDPRQLESRLRWLDKEGGPVAMRRLGGDEPSRLSRLVSEGLPQQRRRRRLRAARPGARAHPAP